jgi:MFS family permease
MRKKMPGYGTTHAPQIQTPDSPVVRGPVPKNFFAVVYSAAFLLSLGGGFLSGKTSYIIVSLFADRDCVGVRSDQCNDALNKYTAASAVTTFTSLGFALFIVPFLTRASDAFGRRIFIQVLSHSAPALCFLKRMKFHFVYRRSHLLTLLFAGRRRHDLLEHQHCPL